MYIESGKVKFYPSAYRQYQDGGETKNINPESELNTEYNITSHIAKLLKKNKGCFIVDYVENVKLEFYLGGYYIHITSPQDILGAFPNATKIWANMKVAPFTPTDNTKGFSELYEVVDYEDNNKNIDELDNNVVSFKGVAFLDTKDQTATFSLCLFSRKDTTSPWYTHTSSKYILDTSEIYNENGDTDISSEFYSLKIKTDDLYSELGKIDYATINSNLEVIGDATFETSVEFAGDLLPTSGSQIDIGRSETPIANIYAENLTATKINLKSQIIPDGTVTLGLANNPITDIYATNIYGTNLKNVNEIDGGQSSITLKSDVIPSGTVDLGSTTNPLNTLYVNTINRYTGNITLGKTITPSTTTVDLGSSTNKFNNSYVGTSYVNTLNSIDAEIKVSKNIIPAPNTTLYIGGSTNQLYGVYAQHFYGNADTATKLNGTSVGGPDNPVYFKNGNPISTGWNSLRLDFLKQFFNDLPITYTGRGSSSATITDDYLRRGIYFALINFNGDRVNCCFYVDRDIEVSTIRNTSVISTNFVHLMNTNYGLGVHKISSGYEFRVFTASEGGTPGNMNNDTVENVTILKTPYIV